MKFEEALQKAREMELDLIEISSTANPPVAKIMDYGKYLYRQKKKEQEASKKMQESETKVIQTGIGTSQHDLEMKAKRIEEFLKEGNRVKIDLVLRGRARFLNKEFTNERLNRVLHFIKEKYRIADGPKSNPRGLSIIIEREK